LFILFLCKPVSQYTVLQPEVLTDILMLITHYYAVYGVVIFHRKQEMT